MKKSKRFLLVAAIIVNCLFASLILNAIWKYHRLWDASGPGQIEMVQMERLDYLEYRQKYSDQLLDDLHYVMLPTLGSCIVASAILFWWFSRVDAAGKRSEGPI